MGLVDSMLVSRKVEGAFRNDPIERTKIRRKKKKQKKKPVILLLNVNTGAVMHTAISEVYAFQSISFSLEKGLKFNQDFPFKIKSSLLVLIYM